MDTLESRQSRKLVCDIRRIVEASNRCGHRCESPLALLADLRCASLALRDAQRAYSVPSNPIAAIRAWGHLCAARHDYALAVLGAGEWITCHYNVVMDRLSAYSVRGVG